ncbi:MAG: hypothetical protein K2N29_05730, partial [Ruminiclostridium sp.]|nr:hypothetical protein [Ruminiclostridium sp.]
AGITGCICLLLREPLLTKLSFFEYRILLRLDSRLLSTKPFLFHSYNRLTSGYYDDKLNEGWLVGMLLLCLLTAFVFTAASRTRFHPFSAALWFGILCAPAFAAEIAGFHPSIIVFTAVFAALCTINNSYELDGRRVFGKPRAARDAMRRNERSYRKRTGFFLFGRKLRSDLPRYFKYNANSFLALLLTGTVLTTSAAFIPDGQGFDYEAFFNSVRDVGVAAADQIGGALGVSFGSVNDNGYFSYSSYGDSSGGIGISEPAEGNIPVLDVILDRNDTSVYLRGDIGVRYTGSGWTGIRDEYGRFTDRNGQSFAEELNDFYPDLQYQVLRQRLSALGYNPDRLFPLQKVSITYRRNTKVVFQPVAAYDLTFKENELFESFGDYILRARSGKGYLKPFEALSLTPFMSNSYMSEAITFAKWSSDLEWTLPDGMSSAVYNDRIATYDRFVKAAYTQTDSSVYAFIEEMRSAGVLAGLSDFDTALAVCRYFKDHFRYSLTTDNGTAEESLESFLYETREGHCALFATAMTLIMRELGVPARYVTGYAASGAGELTEDGRYLYTLCEGDLHAWVEVYFENAGWLPFDPTASVSGFEGNTALPPDPAVTGEDGLPAVTEPPVEYDPTQTTFVSEGAEQTVAITESLAPGGEDPAYLESESTPNEETTKPPETDENGETLPTDESAVGNATGSEADPRPSVPKKSLAEIFVEILPYLTFVAIAVGLAAIVILFIRSVNRAEEQTLQSFRKKPPDRAVGEMYRLVILLLTKEGVPPENETLTDYAVRADASPALKGLNVFMADAMPIFMKCEFGNPEISPVSEEERLAVLKLTSALYRRVIEKKNPISAFFTKISLFL